MSFKTIVTLLMLSCLSATGTALGVPEEPPLEGGVILSPPSLTITAVRWLMDEASIIVQVCVESNLPTGTPSLIYDDGINMTTTTEGVIDDDPHCASFTRNGAYTFTESPARYELIVVDLIEPNVCSGRGVSEFAITVRRTLLICGNSNITKVTWSESETLSDEFQCIKNSENADKACYLDGDITGTELCFVVKDAKELVVNVCLNGPIDYTPPSIGPISSNYFYYGPEPVSNVASDATLSLTMETVPTSMRAIVREVEDITSTETTRVAQAYSCLAVDCTFPAYERKLATYEVCLDVMGASFVTIETATTTFTDLNLNAFDGDLQKSTLVECVFANGLPDLKYQARLFGNLADVSDANDPLSERHIDCTGVAPSHACFGYLDSDGVAGTTVYATVSADDADYSNTIIVPFTIL